jgi:hypothetical protein
MSMDDVEVPSADELPQRPSVREAKAPFHRPIEQGDRPVSARRILLTMWCLAHGTRNRDPMTAMPKRPREMENMLFGAADIEGVDREEKVEWPFVLC